MTRSTDTYDFFSRAEGKGFSMDSEKRVVSIQLPADLSLGQALSMAREMGRLGVGSARSGCSEVHCGRGVWAHVADRRLDVSTARKAASVRFATWDAMEADEVAGGTGLAADCGVALAA